MTIPHQPQEQSADTRPLTYDDAEAAYRSRLLTAGRDRYEELTDREMDARAAARLRERGELDPDNPGHQAIAARQPLTAAEYLERMAIGEALARYYRHPTMLDHAAKAGASWEQIGAARGTSAEQARQDYREWAEGQHGLLTYKDGRFGMSDKDYAEALERAAYGTNRDKAPDDLPDAALPAAADYIRDVAAELEAKAYAETHPVLCAHADQDGAGSHWLEPGERCAALGRAEADADPEVGQ